jgi:hypothetical protein
MTMTLKSLSHEQLQEMAEDLFSTTRAPGSRFWVELTQMERLRWLKVAERAQELFQARELMCR